jgi:hypothetical protein
MGLNRLHNICQKPLALRYQPVFPHLVGDKTNEIRREKDLLDSGRVSETWRWDLQASNETTKNIFVQSLGILHKLDLLLSDVVI